MKKSNDSMGLELVDTLVSQIDASYTLKSDSKGTTCEVLIPIE